MQVQKFISKLLITFTAMVLIVGCASVESHYKETRELDTIEAYEEFIQKYPDSEFANEAKKRLEHLESSQKDFEVAKIKNTIESYKEFIAKYPENEHVKEAEVRIREITLRKKTINDIIEVFIAHGLNGKYIPDNTPTPFIECGAFKGDGFALVIAKFKDWESVYPNINDKARKANIDISCPPKTERKITSRDQGMNINLVYNREEKYKSVKHTDIGPFAMIFVLQSESLEDKRDEILKALEERYEIF
jgi:hypothetical protein